MSLSSTALRVSFFHDGARAWDGFLCVGIAAAFFVLDGGTNVEERPFEPALSAVLVFLCGTNEPVHGG
ncbi:MAG TPA: hypothetical protein VFF64_22635 [Candidatus Eremiobacteraceae bacterium]|nr:hypothetical protein [Candidatus Eremiobacteraceae bacterium]